MLPKAKEHMIKHGLHPIKFNYIPNGIITNEWKIGEEIPVEYSQLISKLQNDGKYIIAYAGSHGIANALDSFIDASKYIVSKNVAFILIGDGPEKNKLIEKVKNESIENVYLMPSVKKNTIPSLLDKMDVLYIGLQNQSLFRFGISPNKLIDYMMAAKPIIQAINAGNDIVSDANCGITVEPENPQKIADAINKLLSLTPSERIMIGEKGKSYCLDNHDYKNLAEKFTDILL
jgi:glycosyltransferase involved in cell wall biosynthesis